jgi:hypothetical protein
MHTERLVRKRTQRKSIDLQSISEAHSLMYVPCMRLIRRRVGNQVVRPAAFRYTMAFLTRPAI